MIVRVVSAVVVASCMQLVSVQQTDTSGRSPLELTVVTSQTIIRKWQEGAPIRAVIVGDSVAQGYYATGWESLQLTAEGDPRGSSKLTIASQADTTVTGWATQLRGLLLSKNESSVLVNESGGGWNSDMILGIARKSEGDSFVDIVGSVIATSPAYDVAFVSLGINDLGHSYPYHLARGQATFRKNLRLIVQRFKTAGVVPVLVKGNDIGRPEFADFMAVVDDIASLESVSTIDGYALFRAAFAAAGDYRLSGLMEDYLHPNQAGHDLLFTQFVKWFNRPIS
jgi:lysophospholipase L1-like esterase